jgi:hypothetical protein
MRKLWSVAAVTVMALFFGTVTTQYAQNITRLEGNIPFDFKVGNNSFASGEYSVKSKGFLLRVMGADGHQNISLFAQPGKDTNHSDTDQGQLIFNKYGDQYFLSKVVSPRVAFEFDIPKSKAEKEVVHTLAAADSKIVVIALNTR